MTRLTKAEREAAATNRANARDESALNGAPPSYFVDVGRFHEKFDLVHFGDCDGSPAPLDPDALAYRLGFLIEELEEFARSQGADVVAGLLAEARAHCSEWPDAPASTFGLADGADALVDLVYVALGTAHLMRLPFDACWAEVQRANMMKERATGADDQRSKRRHALDVVKPAGWKAPDHWPHIYAAATGQ